MFKKFLAGALLALTLIGFGVASACPCDNYNGDYCGRYGCAQ